MTSNPGKFRRQEDILTPKQRQTMKWLVDNGYGIESVMERFGLTEVAAIEYVNTPVEHSPKWQVRWDDSVGERHIKVCESFQEAKEYHSTLRDIEWSRIEKV